MSHETNALPLPDRLGEPSAETLELARIWWSETEPRMVIRPGLRDPFLLGGILAELAWHFSNAYAESQGLEQRAALDTIQRGWAEGFRRAEEALLQDKQ